MSETVFKVGNVTLVLGSSLDLLKEFGPYDGVFADPPYCSGGSARQVALPPSKKYCQTGYSGRSLPDFLGDHMDQRSFMRFGEMWSREALQAANDEAIIATFTDWRQIGATEEYVQIGGWVRRGLVQWTKPSPRPQRGRFAAAAEYLVWGSKGALPLTRDVPPLPGDYRMKAPQKRIHVTEKPVELYCNLFRIVRPGGRIADPFLGSGASALAALKTGQPFVGFELSEGIFNAAVERVEAAYAAAG